MFCNVFFWRPSIDVFNGFFCREINIYDHILTKEKLKEREEHWEKLFQKYSFEQNEEDGIDPLDWAEEEPAINAFLFDPDNEADEDLVIDGAELIATPENVLALLPEQQYDHLTTQFEPGYVDSMVEIFKKKARKAEKMNLLYWDGFRIERLVEEQKKVSENVQTPNWSRQYNSVQQRREHSVATSHGSGPSFAMPKAPARKRRSRSECETPKRPKQELNKFSFSMPASIEKLVADGNGSIQVTMHERTFDIHVHQKDISGILPLVLEASTSGSASETHSSSKNRKKAVPAKWKDEGLPTKKSSKKKSPSKKSSKKKPSTKDDDWDPSMMKN